MTRLLTVGHGTLTADQLSELVCEAGIELVVDVRRFPGSRRHPHFAKDALAVWLPEAGPAYRWEERLGGRRRGGVDSPNTGLRDPSFRAYADHMATPEFGEAFAQLFEDARAQVTAVMCAESLWWRCHRRLIADHATLVRDATVEHVFHDGTLRPHAPTPEAQVLDGVLRYEPSAPTLL